MTMNFLQLVLILCVFSSITCLGLREEFSWTRLTYQWPQGGTIESRYGPIAFPGSTNYPRRTTRRPIKLASSSPRPESDNTGSTGPQAPSSIDYVYQNNIPMGANLWHDKLFITVPRRRAGVPSSLNYVWVNSTQRHNVPLIPYPDWETNTLVRGGEGHFVSVYRVAVDPCDRLWFVDTGLIETLGNPEQIQPGALVIMDLKTDKILHRHVFNSSLLRAGSAFASITVDVTGDHCDDAFAYIPDLSGFGLVVYSLKEDKAWRVTHNYFYLEPQAGEFSIGGHRFQWNDGIFSIALTDVKSDGFRDAFFHSMAGFNKYRVSTKVLRNETTATRSFHEEDFQLVGHKGRMSQTSSSDLHKPSGVIFLALVNQNALGCWNIATPLTDISIVQKDNQKMIYPSDVKISGDNVIVLTNSMPIFLYGQLNYDNTNFRVWVEAIDRAIKGTKCDKKS